jgi:hypothetical protein
MGNCWNVLYWIKQGSREKLLNVQHTACWIRTAYVVCELVCSVSKAHIRNLSCFCYLFVLVVVFLPHRCHFVLRAGRIHVLLHAAHTLRDARSAVGIFCTYPQEMRKCRSFLYRRFVECNILGLAVRGCLRKSLGLAYIRG